MWVSEPRVIRFRKTAVAEVSGVHINMGNKTDGIDSRFKSHFTELIRWQIPSGEDDVCTCISQNFILHLLYTISADPVMINCQASKDEL